ncbi:hypothetical protein QE397_000019 [Rhodococcus sp. SORGH_AS 301]|nr:hypothetical protein [Rhodococcus sp. SORGH_AS_0301]
MHHKRSEWNTGGALGLLWTLLLISIISWPARESYAFVGQDSSPTTDLGDTLAQRLLVLAISYPFLGMLLGYGLSKYLTRRDRRS